MSEPTNNESKDLEKPTTANVASATDATVSATASTEAPVETTVADTEETNEQKPAESEATTEATPVAESPVVDARIPELRPGYKVRVHSKIQQGDKERVQVFEGNIIAINGSSEVTRTITVRKIAAGGYGVERIWPLALPTLVKIEVLERPKVRRSKLYYLRGSLKKMKKLRERA